MTRGAPRIAVIALIAAGLGGCAAEAPARTGAEAGSGGLNTAASRAPAASTFGGHPCPPRITPTPDAHGGVHDVSIDYADVLRFDGRDYQAVDDAPVSQDALGSGIGHVTCTLSGPGHVDPAYLMQDGDATFVPAGATVYTVKGGPAERELAAEHDGVMRVYRTHP